MRELETLSCRVRSWASEEPDHVAIESFRGASLTYRDLDRAIDWRAAAFAEAGAASGSRVLLEAVRSESFVIDLVACWRIGASAVLLDPARTADAETALLKTLGPFVDARQLPATRGDRDRAPGRHRHHAPCRNDEAYVCFTSGSTGVPKGVRISYRGLPELWAHQADLFRAGRRSRTSWLLAAHFDASISDIGVPLWIGGTLVILPETAPANALAFVEAARLTHVDLPPSLLAALAADPERFPCLETIVVGGEPAPAAALRAAAQSFRLINVYGPTETTVCASAELIDPDATPSARPGIGAPLPGVDFHLAPDADTTGRGELYISGWGVGLGYAGSGTATDRSFVEIAPSNAASERVRAYRTGDLVERGSNGLWIFCGRVDRQVQLRGKRLELEEVEAALCAAPEVTGAVATLVEDPAPHVVAIVEGEAPAARTAALERLEPWKQPALIRSTPRLPRLANGKVDVSAAECLARTGALPHGAPKGDALGEAWRAVLGRSSRGHLDENFFDLGGDSVGVLELVVEAARRGVAVPADAVERGRTLGGLRTALRSGETVRDLNGRADAVYARLDLGSPDSAPRDSGLNRRSILLTGATGMLGCALIRSGRLGTRDVVAIVRGKDQRHARERMVRALGMPLPTTLRVECGDLGLPLLGLAAEAFDALEVDDVVHAAGTVDLVRSYASLEDTNVLGTGRAMEMAAQLGARFHHVSTLSIFVESDLESVGSSHEPRACEITEATQLPDDTRIHGGYAQAKYVADALARRYPHGGSVLRLGLLVDPNQTGATDAAAADQLSRVVRGAMALGSWPDKIAERRFDVTPVERAAELLAHLVHTRSTQTDEPVHLAAGISATGAMLLTAIESEGVQLSTSPTWPPADWRGAAGAPTDIAVALAGLAPPTHGLPRSGDLFLTTDRSFKCDYAAANCPSALPAPPSIELLRRCVRAAIRGRSTEVVTP